MSQYLVFFARLITGSERVIHVIIKVWMPQVEENSALPSGSATEMACSVDTTEIAKLKMVIKKSELFSKEFLVFNLCT